MVCIDKFYCSYQLFSLKYFNILCQRIFNYKLTFKKILKFITSNIFSKYHKISDFEY